MSENTMIPNIDLDAALDRIKKAVGDENFITESEELTYFSQDYFNQAEPVTAVIRPKSKEDLARAVAEATAADIAVFPRGGGYSYTDAYLPTRWPAITVDTSHMNRILEINEQDMFVTAECGCTWAELDRALAKRYLRTPFWGPQSGRNATLGGGVSHGATSYGSGKYGITAESVVGLEVVLADGTILTTGSAGQPQHNAFFRHYGPDLTGLFCGDSGAMGVKATVTLRLQRRPSVVYGMSFGCRTFKDASECMASVAREGIATENFGTPNSLIKSAMAQRRLKNDIATLWQVGKTGSNPFSGLVRMIKIGAAGKRFLKDFTHIVNFGLEAPNREIMNGEVAHVRKIIGRRGSEISNSIPLARRAEPFPDHQMLSPKGQRQLPFHTILPFSEVCGFHTDLEELYRRNSDLMQKHGISSVAVFSSMSTNGFLYEPVLQWYAVPESFHRRHTNPAIIEKAEKNEPNLDAREVAQSLRSQIIDLMYEHGGIHLQIGKVYPYLRGRDPALVHALRELKHLVDPKSLINPGALGLA